MCEQYEPSKKVFKTMRMCWEAVGAKVQEEKDPFRDAAERSLIERAEILSDDQVRRMAEGSPYRHDGDELQIARAGGDFAHRIWRALALGRTHICLGTSPVGCRGNYSAGRSIEADFPSLTDRQAILYL